MPALHYHKATFAMLGQTPIRSDDSRAAVERWEQEHEVTLPGAIREWFEIDGSTKLWERYGKDNYPVPLKDLKFETAVRARLPEEENTRRMLRVFAEEMEGEILESLDDPGWLQLMIENQGCCLWYARIDGSDDPAIFNDGDLLEIDQWCAVSGRFSAFLFDWISDACYGDDSSTGLIARHRLPSEEELSYLRAELTEGPPKAAEDAACHYRFFSSQAIVKIGQWPEDWDEVEVVPQWEIRAASLEALEEIARLLWPLGSLAENLRPAYPRDASEKILRKLGQATPQPTTALELFESAEDRSPQEAIELLNRAIELEPTMIRAYKSRIHYHEELQDDEAVVADYTRMLELRKDPYWYLKRGEHLCSLQRFDEVAADICGAIELDPDFGDYTSSAAPLKEAGRSDLFHRVMKHWRDHPPQDRRDYREKIQEYFRGPG